MALAERARADGAVRRAATLVADAGRPVRTRRPLFPDRVGVAPKRDVTATVGVSPAAYASSSATTAR